MHRTLVLASRNHKKAVELSEIMGSSGVEVKTLDQFPDAPEVEETGITFAENALLKARSAAEATGLPSLADDSGLVVDALGSLPGIYSARFAELWQLGAFANQAASFHPSVKNAEVDFSAMPEGKDARNNYLMLALLGQVPENARQSHYECVIALALPQGCSASIFPHLGQQSEKNAWIFSGRCDGSMLAQPRGASGFGYDPLFLSRDLGCTFAEAGSGEKHRVSHRGRALEKLKCALA